MLEHERCRRESANEIMRRLAPVGVHAEDAPFALDLILPPAGVDYIQDLNVRLDIQKAKMPYEKVADMSLAQAAVKLA